jgi:hypothetical protein
VVANEYRCVGNSIPCPEEFEIAAVNLGLHDMGNDCRCVELLLGVATLRTLRTIRSMAESSLSGGQGGLLRSSRLRLGVPNETQQLHLRNHAAFPDFQ